MVGIRWGLCCAVGVILLVAAAASQTPQPMNVEAQRTAMKKLDFLVGRWKGDGRILKPGGDSVEIAQTEQVEYKLAGLLMIIEGQGRSKADGKPALQALAIVSYDDASGSYHMRAFNDGRWLESDMQLASDGKELTWGFTAGTVRTSSILRITPDGEWTEDHEIAVGEAPWRRLMEVNVRRER